MRGNEQKVRTRVPTPVQKKATFGHHVWIGFFRLCGIALVCGAVYYLTRVPDVTIASVGVAGGETISHDDVRARIEHELEGTYFLLVPKRFTYLYPHDRIREVLEKVPRIHHINITRSSRSSIDVTFDEYAPHALWCVYSQPATPCYFIDNDGYAFAEAPLLTGGAFVRHSREGVDTLAEGYVVESHTLAAIDSFSLRLETELGLRVEHIVYRQNGDYEFSLGGGGMILAASDTDLNVTFENLQSVLASKEFSHIKPGNFRYIDVRFENKVFVNEEIDTVASTTAEVAATSTDTAVQTE